MPHKLFSKTLTFLPHVLVLLFLSGLAAVFAWQEPSQPPPDGNVSAPLNTGADGQSKAGGLILNTGDADYGLIVDKGKVAVSEDGIEFSDGKVQNTAFNHNKLGVLDQKSVTLAASEVNASLVGSTKGCNNFIDTRASNYFDKSDFSYIRIGYAVPASRRAVIERVNFNLTGGGGSEDDTACAGLYMARPASGSFNLVCKRSTSSTGPYATFCDINTTIFQAGEGVIFVLDFEGESGGKYFPSVGASNLSVTGSPYPEVILLP